MRKRGAIPKLSISCPRARTTVVGLYFCRLLFEFFVLNEQGIHRLFQFPDVYA